MYSLVKKQDDNLFGDLKDFVRFVRNMVENRTNALNFESSQSGIAEQAIKIQREMLTKMKYIETSSNEMIKKYNEIMNNHHGFLTFEEYTNIIRISNTLEEIKEASDTDNPKNAFVFTMKLIYDTFLSVPESKRDIIEFKLSSNLSVCPEIRGVYDTEVSGYVKTNKAWVSGYSAKLPLNTLANSIIPLNLGQGMYVARLPKDSCIILDNVKNKEGFFSHLADKLSSSIANFGPFTSFSDDRFGSSKTNFPYQWPHEKHADQLDPNNYLGADRNSGIYIARELAYKTNRKTKETYHHYYIFVISYAELHSMKFVRKVIKEEMTLDQISQSEEYKDLMIHSTSKRKHLASQVLEAIMDISKSHVEEEYHKYTELRSIPMKDVSDFHLSSIIKDKKLSKSSSQNVMSVYSDAYNNEGSTIKNTVKENRKYSKDLFLIDGNKIEILKQTPLAFSYKKTSFPYMNWSPSSFQLLEDPDQFNPSLSDVNMANTLRVFEKEKQFTDSKKTEEYSHFNYVKDSHLSYSLNMLDLGITNNRKTHEVEGNISLQRPKNRLFLTVEFSRLSAEVPEQSNHSINQKFMNLENLVYCTTKSDPIVQKVILGTESNECNFVNLYRFTAEIPTEIYLKNSYEGCLDHNNKNSSKTSVTSKKNKKQLGR